MYHNRLKVINLTVKMTNCTFAPSPTKLDILLVLEMKSEKNVILP